MHSSLPDHMQVLPHTSRLKQQMCSAEIGIVTTRPVAAFRSTGTQLGVAVDVGQPVQALFATAHTLSRHSRPHGRRSTPGAIPTAKPWSNPIGHAPKGLNPLHRCPTHGMVCSVFRHPDLGCSPNLAGRAQGRLSLYRCLLQHLFAKTGACLPLCGLPSRQCAQQAVAARQVAVADWDVIFGLALGACRQQWRLGIQVLVDVGVLGCSVPCLLQLGCCQLFRDVGEGSRLGRQHSRGLWVMLGGSRRHCRSGAVRTGCL